jgi:hypothetical protein
MSKYTRFSLSRRTRRRERCRYRLGDVMPRLRVSSAGLRQGSPLPDVENSLTGIVPRILYGAPTRRAPERRAGTCHDATGIRGAPRLADLCQRGVANFTQLSYRKRSRPVEGFATGRDFASTVSGAIFPSAPQSHCPTADRSCGSCTVPRRLRNR